MNAAFLNYFLIFLGSAGLNEHNLTIGVSGVEKFEGQIMLAIYNQKGDFMDEDKMFKALIVPISSDSQPKVSIPLPPGVYAISIFHDLNLDEKLNTNFVGFPREPFGFSNNPTVRFGPPDFDECSFDLSTDRIITINLH